MTDYARIGVGYAARRVADPRIQAQLHAALGDAVTVVNVGAGTGNYEPADRRVVAVEPSPTMIEQRPQGSAPVVRATAEALPFADGSFDAAMAVLTVHHWRDRGAGMRELGRVARRIVVLYFESTATGGLWLGEYWPEMFELASERNPPGEAFFRAHVDVTSIAVVPIPPDCTDGFAGAYWARPEAYLDPTVIRGISSLAQLGAEVYERGAQRLRDDLESGRWDDRNGHLRATDQIDLGYRIVTGSARAAN